MTLDSTTKKKVLPDRPKQPQHFAFITSTGPADEKAAETRTLIRKHVMRDIGKARRKDGGTRRKKPVSIPLYLSPDDVPATDETELLADDPRLEATRSRLKGITRRTDPNQRHGLDPQEASVDTTLVISPEWHKSQKAFKDAMAGSWMPINYTPSILAFDPFQKYPVEMDAQTHELLAFAHTTDKVNHRAFFESWYSVGLGDLSSWHNLMANSAALLLRWRNISRYQVLAIRHNNEAIRSLNSRISNPELATSDGVVHGVVGFTCNGLVTGNHNLWKVNIDALKQIIEQRGGLSTLDGNPPLRWTVTWGDTVGAGNKDLLPSFPYPYHLLPSTSRRIIDEDEPLVNSVLDILQHGSTSDSNIWAILRHMEDLLKDLQTSFHYSGNHTWSQSTYNYQDILPIVHQLLDIQPDLMELDDFNRDTIEFIRLSALLFLAEIRRKFGTCFLETGVQVSKLRFLIQSSSLKSWKLFRPVLLWGLMMGAMEAEDSGEKEWFLQEIINQMADSGLETWESAIDVAKSVFWLEEAHGPLMKRIQQDLASSEELDVDL